MIRSLVRTGRLLAWVLALTVAVVSSATCLLGADMTEAQKACCAAMNHECGEMSVQQDCCATAPNQTAFNAAAARIDQLVQPAVVAVSVATTFDLAASFFESSIVDADAPKPPGRPTYLLVSVFRL